LKTGFVSIIGRANTGKSTLLNRLVLSKVTIVSYVPQTTRYVVRGILHAKDAQIVFVDTPGISFAKKSLVSKLNIPAQKSIVGTDIIYYVVDAKHPPYLEEKRIMEFLLLQKEAKVIMVLNKIDKTEKFINNYISMWNEVALSRFGPESKDGVLGSILSPILYLFQP